MVVVGVVVVGVVVSVVVGGNVVMGFVGVVVIVVIVFDFVVVVVEFVVVDAGTAVVVVVCFILQPVLHDTGHLYRTYLLIRHKLFAASSLQQDILSEQNSDVVVFVVFVVVGVISVDVVVSVVLDHVVLIVDDAVVAEVVGSLLLVVGLAIVVVGVVEVVFSVVFVVAVVIIVVVGVIVDGGVAVLHFPQVRRHDIAIELRIQYSLINSHPTCLSTHVVGIVDGGGVVVVITGCVLVLHFPQVRWHEIVVDLRKQYC